MYEAFFGFSERPFAAAPRADRFYPGASVGAARANLVRCIERGEGVGLIVGPSGTGKSLLCQILARHFEQGFEPVVLASGRLCTRRALLQAILFELKLPYRGLDEGELRLSLVDHLTSERHSRGGMVLLVDEAHTLPWRLLEEIRLISNQARDGKPRVRVVLAGGPALEERFASPKLDSFNQRLSARCYLQPLNRDETAGYLRNELLAAGAEPSSIMTDDAMLAAYRATDGIPRLINQVCDHALILASLSGIRPLRANAIEEAWADLQQLPVPFEQGSARAATSNPIVEFGGLDEEPEAIPFRAEGPRQPTAVEQRLDRLTQHMAELEDDFEPAGMIGPEVEASFSPPLDPFGEDFLEEEVVLDRYASLEADLFGKLPAVSSKEGRELSALLEPFTYSTAEPVAGFVSPAPGAPEKTIATVVKPSKPARPQAAPIEVAGGRETSAPVIRWTNESEAIVQQVSQATFEPDDADLIVVEEDGSNPGGPSNRPSPLVRKQEYRQLFAKLRHG